MRQFRAVIQSPARQPPRLRATQLGPCSRSRGLARKERYQVDVSVTVAGSDSGQIPSLYTWLVGEEELRGRVQLAEPSPSEGTLGSATEALVVPLGPGVRRADPPTS